MSGYGNDNYQGGGGYGGGDDYSQGQQRGGGYGSNNDNYDQTSQTAGSGGGYGQQGGSYGDDRRSNMGGGQGGYSGGGNMPQGGSYGGGGGYGADDDDLSGAASHAQQHAGAAGDSNIFSNVLGMLGQNKQSIANTNIDENHAVQAHQQFFGNGGGSGQPADSHSMGSAAAMQALKMFTGGSSGGSQQGNSQNAFVGMAMAQASKLFDQQNAQGNISSGADKESAVQQAGKMALNMYMKSQGGNAGGLMGLASKFM